jgi:hypothetical protein
MIPGFDWRLPASRPVLLGIAPAEDPPALRLFHFAGIATGAAHFTPMRQAG